jgi:uncharacterized membrane protein YphA (DoxX/SURF4 family)
MLEWSQVPAGLPAHRIIADIHGGILIVTGLLLVFGRFVRCAAYILGAVWLIWTLLCVPQAIANWRGLIGLQAELLGMTSGIFMLAALSGENVHRGLAVVCRYAFALCLPIYGLVHFLYPSGVASWIPKWLLFPLFWAYFTGVAHCAAGLSLLTGVLARLGTKLFAIMLSSWVLILHIPRVAAAVHDRHEWTTLFIAVSLTGAAWVLAAGVSTVLPRRKP